MSDIEVFEQSLMYMTLSILFVKWEYLFQLVCKKNQSLHTFLPSRELRLAVWALAIFVGSLLRCCSSLSTVLNNCGITVSADWGTFRAGWLVDPVLVLPFVFTSKLLSQCYDSCESRCCLKRDDPCMFKIVQICKKAWQLNDFNSHAIVVCNYMREFIRHFDLVIPAFGLSKAPALMTVCDSHIFRE